MRAGFVKFVMSVGAHENHEVRFLSLVHSLPKQCDEIRREMPSHSGGAIDRISAHE